MCDVAKIPLTPFDCEKQLWLVHSTTVKETYSHDSETQQDKPLLCNDGVVFMYCNLLIIGFLQGFCIVTVTNETKSFPGLGRTPSSPETSNAFACGRPGDGGG